MNKLLLGLLLAGITHVAFAGHHEKEPMAETEAMSEEAMMEAFMAAATPGEPHAKLAESVGIYTADMKFYMDPSAAPEMSTMAVERSMDMEGRVLVERWSGMTMGMPFIGVARTGYDNVTKRYWSTWTDNLSTGVMIMYGDWDDEADALVFHGEATHPMTGAPYTMRSVSTYLSDGAEKMQMFEDHGQGEYLSMEFTLTPNAD